MSPDWGRHVSVQTLFEPEDPIESQGQSVLREHPFSTSYDKPTLQKSRTYKAQEVLSANPMRKHFCKPEKSKAEMGNWRHFEIEGHQLETGVQLWESFDYPKITLHNPKP